jgi:hypothetical protein
MVNARLPKGNFAAANVAAEAGSRLVTGRRRAATKNRENNPMQSKNAAEWNFHKQSARLRFAGGRLCRPSGFVGALSLRLNLWIYAFRFTLQI